MKTKHLILIFVLFAFVGLNPLGKIRIFNNYITQGEELIVHTNLVNSLGEKLKDVSVTLYLPELGIFTRTSSLDLGKSEKQGRFLFLETKNIPPGTYLVRIVASNDKFKDVKHRYIVIE